jgi:hypothetical protein
MVKAKIQCPYCPASAKPLRGDFGKPVWQGWTRYGCDNAHFFAVPTHKVIVRELPKAA